MANRLTGEDFREMLKRHPDFELIEGFTLLPSESGTEPCAGCAMALSYFDEHPERNYIAAPSEVSKWIVEKYDYHLPGECYSVDFARAFDNDLDDEPSKLDVAVKDGLDCRRVAKEMGRLHYL